MDRFSIPYTRPGQVIGLFGGSFDPPHQGHVHVTLEALKSRVVMCQYCVFILISAKGTWPCSIGAAYGGGAGDDAASSGRGDGYRSVDRHARDGGYTGGDAKALSAGPICLADGCRQSGAVSPLEGLATDHGQRTGGRGGAAGGSDIGPDVSGGARIFTVQDRWAGAAFAWAGCCAGVVFRECAYDQCQLD